jgi:hypothetical protein
MGDLNDFRGFKCSTNRRCFSVEENIVQQRLRSLDVFDFR